MKLVIVMRTDLNMRKGKMCSQAGHAVTEIIFESHHEKVADWYYKHNQKKICVGVDSLEELQQLYEKAKANNILCSIIADAGHTEFKEPTITCIAIGPDEDEVINEITGQLKLL